MNTDKYIPVNERLAGRIHECIIRHRYTRIIRLVLQVNKGETKKTAEITAEVEYFSSTKIGPQDMASVIDLIDLEMTRFGAQFELIEKVKDDIKEQLS